jgi:hypothetical protein
MTERAAGQRRNLPPAARSASTPSLSTSPVIGASAGSPSRGGRSRRRDGVLELDAPPTASEGRPDEAGLSAPRGHPSRWPPRGGGPPTGPLGWGELRIASSTLHSSRTWLSMAAATMILWWRGEAVTRTTPTCRSNPPPRWPRRRSTMASAMDLRWRRRHTPLPSAS